MRKEVNAAVERGDAQTVNTLGLQEHLLEDQLLEAMKTAKAAGETEFNRPVSQPQPSPAPEVKVETSPGVPENIGPADSITPASSTGYEGKTASEMLAEVHEWDKQEKAAVDSSNLAAEDSVKGAAGISTVGDVKLEMRSMEH